MHSSHSYFAVLCHYIFALEPPVYLPHSSTLEYKCSTSQCNSAHSLTVQHNSCYFYYSVLRIILQISTISLSQVLIILIQYFTLLPKISPLVAHLPHSIIDTSFVLPQEGPVTIYNTCLKQSPPKYYCCCYYYFFLSLHRFFLALFLFNQW